MTVIVSGEVSGEDFQRPHIVLRFTCPKCGGHEIEHECSLPSQYAMITGLECSDGSFKLQYQQDSDGMIQWEWDETAENRHSFRCEGCLTDIECRDEEALVEWLKAHCTEAENEEDCEEDEEWDGEEDDEDDDDGEEEED